MATKQKKAAKKAVAKPKKTVKKVATKPKKTVKKAVAKPKKTAKTAQKPKTTTKKTISSNSTKAKKYRYGKTRQGYQITNMLTDQYGRKTIVGKRQSDYFVAKGYNSSGDGRWAQGYYGFSDRKSAVNFAKNVSYYKKR